MLHLPQRYQSAWIIDGQHRLFGYAHLEQKYLDQNILVIAFEELSGEDEANLFVTINHEQETVPKTLLDELEGELKWGSSIPSERIGSIGARLIGLLNQDVGEPFYDRIVQQGIPTTERTCLTTPQLKDGLRKSGLIGKSLKGNKIYQAGYFSGDNDSKTLKRAHLGLNLFFSEIRGANRIKWDEGRSSNICNNIAIQAYFRLFAEMIKFIEKKDSLNIQALQPEELIAKIKHLLKPIIKYLSSLSNFDVVGIEVIYGSGGPPHYFFQLCKLINKEIKQFDPEGYSDWETEQSKEKILVAEQQLKDLNSLSISYIFNKFKELYGEVDYYEMGVTSRDMKTGAYTRSQEDEVKKRMPLENYLNFIDLKKIIEKDHWELFKSVFNIPEIGEKGKAKNLKWMTRINELRRIPAHQTEARKFTVNDFKYLDWIAEEFKKRLDLVQQQEV